MYKHCILTPSNDGLYCYNQRKQRLFGVFHW